MDKQVEEIVQEHLPGIIKGKMDAESIGFKKLKSLFEGGEAAVAEYMKSKTPGYDYVNIVAWQAGFFSTITGALWQSLAAVKKEIDYVSDNAKPSPMKLDD